VTEAVLWYLRPDRLAPDCLPGLLGLLAPDERSRWRALRHPDARLQFLAARALVRAALSAHVPEVSPGAWRFRRARHGKPEVAAPRRALGLRFNLTHTRGLVACLVAGVPVGIDAEPWARRLDPMALATRFFTQAEAAALAPLTPGQRRRRFLELWTLKEAYLKGRGTGLAGGLDVGPACGWGLGLVPVSAEHVVAVAVRAPVTRVHVRLLAASA
jgi:4'-phosphopantetheinyl transferase